MKIFAALPLLALLLSVALPAQTSGNASEDTAVRAVVQREIDGWEKYDPEAVSSCYTVNTTWQNPFGVRIHSRSDLKRFLTNLMQRPGYRSAKETAPARITDVQILSPTTAVVWGEEKSEGQVDDATGKKMAPRYSHTLEVLTKENGQWLISDMMIMDEYPRPQPAPKAQ